MKVARRVREEAVGKGLALVSTSLAAYFMPKTWGNAWDMTKGGREYRRDMGRYA
jgi:hypothetical protein